MIFVACVVTTQIRPKDKRSKDGTYDEAGTF